MTAYSCVLLAVETVPLLFYIFMGLVVLAVPVAFIWDKYIQPGIDAKKQSQKEAEKAEEEGEPELEAAAEEDESPFGAMDELALPADEDEAPGDAPAGSAEPATTMFAESPAADAKAGQGLFDGAGSDDLGEVDFEAGDPFSEEPDEKPGG